MGDSFNNKSLKKNPLIISLMCLNKKKTQIIKFLKDQLFIKAENNPQIKSLDKHRKI